MGNAETGDAWQHAPGGFVRGRLLRSVGRIAQIPAAGRAHRSSLRRSFPAVLMHATFAILALAWGAAALAANGNDAQLGKLMALLAQRKHGEVTYVEKDYLAILDRPLTSSGVLIYDAPDHLEKKTLKPRKESLVLEHGELTVRRGNRTYHLDLREYPQVAPYIDAIRATLAGDLGALEKVFRVRFDGSLGHWRLRLVPRDERVAQQLRRIRIAGAAASVESVEIDKDNGDRSVMIMGTAAGAAGR
jgi:hypothetical protein